MHACLLLWKKEKILVSTGLPAKQSIGETEERLWPWISCPYMLILMHTQWSCIPSTSPPHTLFINSVPHFLAPNPCQTAIQTLFTVYSQIQIIAHSRSMTSYPEGNPLPYINDSQISFCNPNPCQWRHLGRQHAHF